MPTATDWSLSQIVFYLNGTRVKVDGNRVDPDSSLLAFIRDSGLTGTKLGCGEGGCGACTVVVQSKHPHTGQVQHLAINACLAPLASSLGSSENPHPLQERLWKLAGSQCGFCTPGIVMSIYALLRNAAYAGKLSIEDVELAGALDGNLCSTGYAPIFTAAKSFVGDYLNPTKRSEDKGVNQSIPFNWAAADLLEHQPRLCIDNECNGHGRNSSSNGVPLEEISTDIAMPAPSARDMPSGSTDPPIDKSAGAMSRTAPVNGKGSDVLPKLRSRGCGRPDCCQLSGKDSVGSSDNVKKTKRTFPLFDFKPYQPGTELIYPPGLAKHTPRPLKFGSAERTWYRPTTLAQVLELKKIEPEAKLVGGSSEVAIEVGILGRKYPSSIYVADVPELYGLCRPKLNDDRPVLTFGANLPLSELEEACKQLAEELPSEVAGPVEAIRDQLRYFAGRQVRNAASVGGNIATASPISDLNPVWMAVDAKLVAATFDKGEIELPLASFFTGYRKTTLPPDAVITKVVVPLNKGDDSSDNQYVKAFKQAKRRDDDISIVCACMLIETSKEDGKVTRARVAFGGMAAWTVQAQQTETFLLGKALSDETLQEALDTLANEFNLGFDVPGGMPSYRKTLALSFLFRFIVGAANRFGITLGGDQVGPNVGDVTDIIHRGPSSSWQDFSDPYALETTGQSLPHTSGLQHVTGEAVFIDDLPKHNNELNLVLVLSTKAHAKILSVDTSEALELEGVVGYVDHRDLHDPKANYWGAAALDETFFAVDEVVSHGQIIGGILATTKLAATRAARAVKIEYEDLPFILTIEEAIAQQSYFPQYDRRIAKGQEIDEALDAAENVLSDVTRMGGQEHFYLETMAALVVPKLEHGEIEVFSSTQALTETQRWIAQVTGVPRNRIVAKAKRIGGGYGGKESRTALVSTVAAVAAKKFRRPVRIMLDRDADIRISGQRHPFRAEWSVGFTNEGKIQALKCELYANGGYSLDISGGVADRALAHLDNCYFIENFDARARLCKTNTVSNTAFRGFGGNQGMLISESYIERIADHLKIDIDRIREVNLYKEGQRTPYHQPVLDWYVPKMLQDCSAHSNYSHRKEAVAAFNKEHKWRKRGLALLPTKFGLAFGIKAMNQGAALVHIYVDGSVLVAHGGIEMGQGLYTKCTQIAAQALNIPHEAIFTAESATNTVPNTVPTAASAGSDLNGHAVHNACMELNERLQPYRDRLGPEATMAALANAAWQDRVSLSATGYYASPTLGYVWRSHAEGGGRDDEGKVGNMFVYYTTGVAASEVEVDILTGDHTVLRTDIMMDIGKSLNPAVDIGQIQGAFIQGMGWSTIEESLWLTKSGALATVGPGAYKIPGFADIPQEFNVWTLKGVEWKNLPTIRGSKGVGEPPLFLGASVALSIRHALKSARADAGVFDTQPFRTPLTSERIRLAAGDFLATRGNVESQGGQKGWFTHI
ncbi:hypothetical protein OIO90_005249 [Microbotryomycetes sp. JL221]|nr:hypothetical protein OIO90_005249 [Microbotryomycetes sp. JL221]